MLFTGNKELQNAIQVLFHPFSQLLLQIKETTFQIFLSLGINGR